MLANSDAKVYELCEDVLMHNSKDVTMVENLILLILDATLLSFLNYQSKFVYS